jgi:hypothetical protein
MGNIECIGSPGRRAAEMMNAIPPTWWVIMQDFELFDRYLAPSCGETSRPAAFAIGIGGAHGAGHTRHAGRRADDLHIETSRRRFAALLAEWAREFTVTHGIGSGPSDDQLVGTLARLLREGAEAAVWKVDDAGTTAAFLLAGSRRLIERSSAARPHVRDDLASTIVAMCGRVIAAPEGAM